MTGTTTGAERPAPSMRYRAIWISDLHLGTPGCKAEALLDFLRRTESDYLYLVGDVVDASALRQRWHWPQAHNDVVQKLFRKARKGTRVIYVPGNHDDSVRQFAALAFGGVRVELETLHVTATGRRLLVVHGDQFDLAVRHRAWYTLLGHGARTVLRRASRRAGPIATRMGLDPWSLAGFLKKRAPTTDALDTFEQAAAAEARRIGADGVVCGHIHKPTLRMVGGTLYCNDGDWVDNLSALVETEAGELLLIDREGRPMPVAKREARPASPPPRRLFPVPPELEPSPAE